MKSFIHNQGIIAVSFILYAVLWFLLNSSLQYNLDSDCVAYLTIAKRAAQGDWFKSINGLWSPLNGWMLLPFIQSSFDAWNSALALNCFLGGIVLLQLNNLFSSYISNFVWCLALAICLPFPLVYFVYLQSFGDILQLIFLLAYLTIVWAKPLTGSYNRILFCTLIMGIAIYAKSYTFIFFLLHFTALLVIERWSVSRKIGLSLSSWALGLLVFILTLLPWSIALYKKYGVFSLSGLAGKLNMSWYINSGKTFKESIGLLIPPVYSDSPSFWEDPYFSQTNLSSPLSSLTHFSKWIARALYTSIEYLICLNEISVLAIAIMVASVLLYFYERKTKLLSKNILEQLLVVSLVLPLGYITMHVETRYLLLYYLTIPIMAYVLVEATSAFGRYKNLIGIIVAVSLLVFPITELKRLRNKNKDLFEKASVLGLMNFKGKWTSNSTDAGRMWVIAYLTNTQFYTIEQNDYKEEELVIEMKRYGLNYYFFEAENNMIQPDKVSPPFKYEYDCIGSKVYSFVP